MVSEQGRHYKPQFYTLYCSIHLETDIKFCFIILLVKIVKGKGCILYPILYVIYNLMQIKTGIKFLFLILLV